MKNVIKYCGAMAMFCLCLALLLSNTERPAKADGFQNPVTPTYNSILNFLNPANNFYGTFTGTFNATNSGVWMTPLFVTNSTANTAHIYLGGTSLGGHVADLSESPAGFSITDLTGNGTITLGTATQNTIVGQNMSVVGSETIATNLTVGGDISAAGPVTVSGTLTANKYTLLNTLSIAGQTTITITNLPGSVYLDPVVGNDGNIGTNILYPFKTAFAALTWMTNNPGWTNLLIAPGRVVYEQIALPGWNLAPSGPGPMPLVSGGDILTNAWIRRPGATNMWIAPFNSKAVTNGFNGSANLSNNFGLGLFCVGYGGATNVLRFPAFFTITGIPTNTVDTTLGTACGISNAYIGVYMPAGENPNNTNWTFVVPCRTYGIALVGTNSTVTGIAAMFAGAINSSGEQGEAMLVADSSASGVTNSFFNDYVDFGQKHLIEDIHNNGGGGTLYSGLWVGDCQDDAFASANGPAITFSGATSGPSRTHSLWTNIVFFHHTNQVTVNTSALFAHTGETTSSNVICEAKNCWFFNWSTGVQTGQGVTNVDGCTFVNCPIGATISTGNGGGTLGQMINCFFNGCNKPVDFSTATNCNVVFTNDFFGDFGGSSGSAFTFFNSVYCTNCVTNCVFAQSTNNVGRVWGNFTSGSPGSNYLYFYGNLCSEISGSAVYSSANPGTILGADSNNFYLCNRIGVVNAVNYANLAAWQAAFPTLDVHSVTTGPAPGSNAFIAPIPSIGPSPTVSMPNGTLKAYHIKTASLTVGNLPVFQALGVDTNFTWLQGNVSIGNTQGSFPSGSSGNMIVDSNLAVLGVMSGNGAGLTNVTATVIIVNTNWVSGQIYTNLTGRPITVSGSVVLTTASVAGYSQMALQVPGSVTNYATVISAVAGLTGAMTNGMSPVFVSPFGTFTWTNTSSGAGDSSGTWGGQYLIH